MIRFLEQLVGADAGFLELLELIHRQRRDVHVHAANFATTALRRVNRVNRLEDVIESFFRIFLARDEQQPFVTLINQHLHVGGDFVRRQRAAFQLGVAGAEGAVAAFVFAQIGNI